MTLNNSSETETIDLELKEKLDRLVEACSNPETQKNIEDYCEIFSKNLAKALVVPKKTLNQPFTI